MAPFKTMEEELTYIFDVKLTQKKRKRHDNSEAGSAKSSMKRHE